MTVPKRYDVYGFRASNLEAARQFVESTLGVKLEQRDSSYWGGYYSTGRGPGHDLMLYANEQGEWSTGEHAAFPVILLVNDLDRMDEIQKTLTEGRNEPVLLRSRVLPEEPPDDPRAV